jgi:hypothetical protein
MRLRAHRKWSCTLKSLYATPRSCTKAGVAQRPRGCCWVPGNRVPKEGPKTSQKWSAYQEVRWEGPKGHMGTTHQVDWPIEQLSAEQPSEARLPTNPPAEPPNEARLPTNLVAEQHSEAMLPTNLPTEQPSEVRLPTNQSSEQPSKMTTDSQKESTWYYQATLTRWDITKPCSNYGSGVEGSLSGTTPDTYPYWLVGPDNLGRRNLNIGRRNLNIGVSTVTHTLKGTGQYAIPCVRLRMMKDGAREMTEDEVVLKTPLNHSLSWLNRTCQAPPRLNRSSCRKANMTWRHTRRMAAHALTDDSHYNTPYLLWHSPFVIDKWIYVRD